MPLNAVKQCRQPLAAMAALLLFDSSAVLALNILKMNEAIKTQHTSLIVT
jgi:hypothetical protein